MRRAAPRRADQSRSASVARNTRRQHARPVRPRCHDGDGGAPHVCRCASSPRPPPDRADGLGLRDQARRPRCGARKRDGPACGTFRRASTSRRRFSRSGTPGPSSRRPARTSPRTGLRRTSARRPTTTRQSAPSTTAPRRPSPTCRSRVRPVAPTRSASGRPATRAATATHRLHAHRGRVLERAPERRDPGRPGQGAARGYAAMPSGSCPDFLAASESSPAPPFFFAAALARRAWLAFALRRIMSARRCSRPTR